MHLILKEWAAQRAVSFSYVNYLYFFVTYLPKEMSETGKGNTISGKYLYHTLPDLQELRSTNQLYSPQRDRVINTPLTIVQCQERGIYILLRHKCSALPKKFLQKNGKEKDNSPDQTQSHQTQLFHVTKVSRRPFVTESIIFNTCSTL